MATPFLLTLRKRFPSARVTVACRGYVSEIFRRCVPVDSLVEFGSRGVRARASAIAGSRPRGGYDACFVLSPSFSSAFVSLFSRARRRIGFNGQGRGLFLTNALPAPLYRATHLSEAYVRLLGPVTGIEEREIPLPVVIPPSSWSETVKRLSGGKPYFVLAPGGTYGTSKIWPHDRFSALAARLAARTGWMPLVVGRNEERPAAAALLEAARAGGRNCAGGLSIEELVSVLRGSGVTIGNDSGPVHIAAALGRPTVAIFGPSSAEWTAPRGRAVRIVTGEAPCAPCFKRDCPYGQPTCLLLVDVDAVYRAACSLIEGG